MLAFACRLTVAVPSELSVADAHTVAKEVRHQLMHHLNYFSSVVVHVDPIEEAGEEFYHIGAHSHDGLPVRFALT